MPLALALIGSLLIHLGALFGAAWEFPGLSASDASAVVEAVLLPAAKASVATAAPLPRRQRPVLKRAKPLPPPSEEVPALVAPVLAPIAVPPEPTFEAAPALADASPAADVATPAPDIPVEQPTPIALPGKGRVNYLVMRGEQGFVVGKSQHDWEHDNKTYHARSVTETTGLIAIFNSAQVVQTSTGRVTPNGLQPIAFRHEKVKGVDSASFDWAQHLLSFEGKQVPLPDGTQDMLSLYYQAVLDALAGKPLDVPVTTGRKLETYHFEAKGEESLSLAGKDWRTQHYVAKSGADLIELWIAPDLPGLPLKIRFVDRKGDSYEQIADAIETKEKP